MINARHAILQDTVHLVFLVTNMTLLQQNAFVAQLIFAKFVKLVLLASHVKMVTINRFIIIKYKKNNNNNKKDLQLTQL